MPLELKQTQKLQQKMTPELYQAISLLQLNQWELDTYIQEQLNENPLMEYQPPSSFSPTSVSTAKPSQTEIIEATLSQKQNVRDTLIEQWRLNHAKAHDYKIGVYIIHSLDDAGYLPDELPHIATLFDIEEERVRQTLEAVQLLDPPGVGARSLQECLRLQLKRLPKRDELAERIVTEHIEVFMTEDWSKLADQLHVEPDEVRMACDLIRQLNPNPLSSVASERETIIPDIIIAKINGMFECQMADHWSTGLRISNDYFDRFKSSEAADFVKEKRHQAFWLLRALERRRQTLTNICNYFINQQTAFLETGNPADLTPLTMKQMAEAIDVHESTVSRAIKNKYMQIPGGIFLFKSLFLKPQGDDQGQATVFKIKMMLREFIEQENPTKPYSDQAIAKKLTSEKGVRLSRRAVAKYREELNIPSSRKRKKRS